MYKYFCSECGTWDPLTELVVIDHETDSPVDEICGACEALNSIKEVEENTWTDPLE